MKIFLMLLGAILLLNYAQPGPPCYEMGGDLDFTLARYTWVRGEKCHEEIGQVASWIGICRGWAAAAHRNAPIPVRPVLLIAASGLPLTFYPQDIKALQSMLQATEA